MRRWFASLFVILIGFAASEARAIGCQPGQSPFTDVPDSAIFCAEALWLRNALVTVGCTSATLYCPTQTVTRAQMALFMNRLATAVTPDTVVFYDQNAFQGDLDTGDGVITCVSNLYSIPAAANGRLLSGAIGSVSIQTNGVADIGLGIEISSNGGPFFTMTGTPPVVHVPAANQWTPVTVIAGAGVIGGNGVTLAPGGTYQWRLRLARLSAATTGDVTNTTCQLKIDLPVDPVAL